MRDKVNKEKKYYSKHTVKQLDGNTPAERLRLTRERYNFSRSALADKALCDRQYIYQLETGKRKINTEHPTQVFESLAKALGVSVNYLLCKTDFMNDREEIIAKRRGKISDEQKKELAVSNFVRELMHIYRIGIANEKTVLWSDNDQQYEITLEQYRLLREQIFQFADYMKKILDIMVQPMPAAYDPDIHEFMDLTVFADFDDFFVFRGESDDFSE